jgi:hypothetical protein
VPGRDSWLLLAGMIQVNLVDVDVRSNTTSSISSTNKKIIAGWHDLIQQILTIMINYQFEFFINF